MKNKLFFSFFALLSLSLTSCINIIEEIWINKDNSGRYTYTVDMSPSLKQMEKFASSFSDEAKTKDEARKDTIVYLSDLPDSIKQKVAHPEILERISMRSVSDPKEKKVYMTVFFDFKNLDEMKDFQTVFETLKTQQSKTQNGKPDNMGLTPSPGQYTFNDGRFSYQITPNPDKSKEEDLKSNPFIKMFLKDTHYEVIAHLPENAKTAAGLANPSINGNIVKTSVPLADLIQNPKKMDFEAQIVDK